MFYMAVLLDNDTDHYYAHVGGGPGSVAADLLCWAGVLCPTQRNPIPRQPSPAMCIYEESLLALLLLLSPLPRARR